MKTIRIITLAILAALLPAAIQPAAAALPSAAGLEVVLLQGDATIASTSTDAEGAFALADVAAGTYALSVGDTAVTMSLRFPLEVTAEQAPATVTGRVEISPDIAIGFAIEVRVVSAAGLSVDGADVRPRKWNLNYSHSQGSVKVFLRGTGLANVTTVTLRSATGSLSSTDIRVGDAVDDGLVDLDAARAFFPKAAAWAALMPAGTARGDIVPLEIAILGAGYSATFTQDIIILGSNTGTGR